MRTSIIGRTFIELDSVDSTNKYAADLIAAKKAPHGTVILAHEQTHGRGQRGRIWKSAAGLDIALSVTEKVTVMHNGAVLKTGTPEQIENDAQVQAIYMGNHH